MAAYSSSGSGNWSSAATWGGGGVPGDGDTAAIGAHAVVVDVGTTVGTSPASLGMVVTVADNGSLTIAEDVTLTVKGGIQCNSAPLTLSAGAGIVVVAGTGVNYRIQPGVTGDPLGGLYCNGTAAKRCSITKTGAGTAEIYHYLSTSSGEFKCAYTDFSNLGSTGAAYSITVRRDFQVSYCTFTNCGVIVGSGSTIDADKNLIIDYCTFRGSLGTNVQDIRCTTAPDSGKVRRIRGNSYDKALVIADMRGGTVTDNYFAVQPTLSSATYRPDTWSGNFVVVAAGAETPVATITNDYRYNKETDNSHLAVCSDMSQTWDGLIFESGVEWSTNEHDGVIQATSPTSSRTYVVQNCISLPAPNRKTSCTLFTAACDANAVWRVKNNTIYAGDRGHGFIGVHHDGVAGMVDYFKNNIAWADVGDTVSNLLAYDPLISIADDYVTVCGYNGYINMATPYDVPSSAFAGTAGTGDVVETDPDFVDDTRCLPKFAEVFLGATGTDSQKRTAALNWLANMNDPSSAYYVSGLGGVPHLIKWVKAGFAPRATAYHTASDTGGYIGALDYGDSVIDVTVSDADVAVTTVETYSLAQATITGTSDITNGTWRSIRVKARNGYAEQAVDSSVDGTASTTAETADSYTTVRVGCYGSGLTQQPNGLISQLKIYKEIL